ncbi:MAG: transcriptional regulator [Desulfobacterales bacterium]|nr:transcriptional regulator [Desulfobacterales bacterium]MDD4071562.1 transcriptional regulator [Desulfobacterales bacterium]MDD4391551.1 transcriptional regulator [Desulfobacterales bacterium]
MGTLRQKMADLLAQEVMNARDLSQALSITEKEVYDHLTHLEQSLKRQKKKLIVIPYQCLECGYAFRNRKRLTRPGRCPHCREGHIQEALYHIE